MPVLNVISSYGMESNSYVVTVNSITYNFYNIGSALYIKNITANTPPTILITNTSSYTVLNTLDTFCVFYISSNILYKRLIDITSLSTLSTTQIQTNISWVNAIFITYYRVVYVSNNKLMYIDDYYSIFDSVPYNNYKIQLISEHIYTNIT